MPDFMCENQRNDLRLWTVLSSWRADSVLCLAAVRLVHAQVTFVPSVWPFNEWIPVEILTWDFYLSPFFWAGLDSSFCSPSLKTPIVESLPS